MSSSQQHNSTPAHQKSLLIGPRKRKRSPVYSKRLRKVHWANKRDFQKVSFQPDDASSFCLFPARLPKILESTASQAVKPRQGPPTSILRITRYSKPGYYLPRTWDRTCSGRPSGSSSTVPSPPQLFNHRVRGGKYTGFRAKFIKHTPKRVLVDLEGVGERYLHPKNLHQPPLKKSNFFPFQLPVPIKEVKFPLFWPSFPDLPLFISHCWASKKAQCDSTQTHCWGQSKSSSVTAL